MGLDSETNTQFIIITELHSSWMLVKSLISLTSQTRSGEERVWIWIARLILNSLLLLNFILHGCL